MAVVAAVAAKRWGGTKVVAIKVRRDLRRCRSGLSRRQEEKNTRKKRGLFSIS